LWHLSAKNAAGIFANDLKPWSKAFSAANIHIVIHDSSPENYLSTKILASLSEKFQKMEPKSIVFIELLTCDVLF
jgi:hypothetical protein